jgi:hypothetical protein
MRNFRKFLMIGVGAAVLATIPHSAKAQVNSNAPTVTLNATLAESLTVSVTAGSTVNFNLAPNTAANPGLSTSTINTAWVLKPGRTLVTVWAWVADGTQALNDGAAGDKIPASAVTAAASGSGSAGGALNAKASGGAGVPAFITPVAATGVQIGNVTITGANKNSSTTTTLTWNIDTTFNAQLPANTYTGTVNIQAQATP